MISEHTPIQTGVLFGALLALNGQKHTICDKICVFLHCCNPHKIQYGVYPHQGL